jgi:hypothetical protein
MAASTALSTSLAALAERIAPGLEGKAVPTPAELYSAIIHARDKAVCLEARAGDRDRQVHALLKGVSTMCEELGNLARQPGMLAAAIRAESTISERIAR